MNVLDRYLAGRLLSVFAKVVLSLVLLVCLIDLVVTRQSAIARYQVPWLVVLQYYLTFAPTILFEYHAAAVSLLVAALIVLGRAAQDNEILALLAGGVSLRRIVRAPVAVAFLIALLVFAVQESYGVHASKLHRHIQSRFFSKITDRTRHGVSWTNLGDGWTCHILKFNTRANSGQDVYLHAFRGKRLEEIRANRIYWDEEKSKWLLEDGRRAIFDQDKEWEILSSRITQEEAPFQEPPEKLFALSVSAQEKSAGDLSRDIEEARSMGVPVREHLVNYHVKFAQPALCFVIIWLAIPFAIRLRKGGIMMSFGVSAMIALVYLVLFAVGVGLGYMGTLPPPAAAWAANALFFIVGLLLFRRVPT
ncbi:MAG TPA: LptF/LptG family permease [Candidatus Hydrogenedentes bacterium]|jgi:lipopolysaccharide export system permease protein|nr:MAG: putative permease YjgP/YjgQ family protein [Candidatus Hydrogenedentes bacterium ADurb.Bin170]HNZ49159.1 LptF/LptG family permease [Candidatus Hydrogenedentota bacterium]HOD96504.1 LptF/LptG family permease [Candidatus Hydrogenedentota bacterium]HOH42658.1 LptF/LptG family permease [Candidatus Hydrogenedentota bacterium]HOM47985.1 LptF/LptG family permease [Candidatus Hydrogenedentota bacterium]